MSEPAYAGTMSAHEGMNGKQKPWMLSDNQVAWAEGLDIAKLGAAKLSKGVVGYGKVANYPWGFGKNYISADHEDHFYIPTSAGIFKMTNEGIVSAIYWSSTLVSNVYQGVEGLYNANPTLFFVPTQMQSTADTACYFMVSQAENVTAYHAPNPSCGCFFQNRLWLGGKNSTVRFSDLANPLVFSAGNSFQFEPGVGGDKVTGIVPVAAGTPALLLFKKRAVSLFQPYWGSSSSLIPISADALDTIKSSINTVSSTVGCVAPLSIQNCPGAPGGDLYFLAADGVRAITKSKFDAIQGVSTPLSDPIKDVMDRVNWAMAHICVSAYWDAKYFLGVPLDGANDNSHLLIFDTINGAWSVFAWTPGHLVSANTFNGPPELWMAYNALTTDSTITGLANGYHVFNCFSSGYLAPGNLPVAWRLDTKGFHFGDLSVKKTWDRVAVTMSNNAAHTGVYAICYNIDQTGWVTLPTCVIGDIAAEAVVLGETPLPWGRLTGFIKTFRYSLADTPPGVEIQVRMASTSDLSIPVIYSVVVGARPLVNEFDNEIG
jgi:hypothetical protein